MKKKVLSALLAVALFVGLAVPAFADWNTSAEGGDAEKITAMAFAKASYSVADGDSIELDDEIIAYVGDSKICQDHTAFEWTISDNDALGIDNNGKVSAIDSRGSATVTVKAENGKKASVKVTAKAAPADAKEALGWSFVSTTVKMVSNHTANVIEIAPNPAGSVFTSAQITAITAALQGKINNAAGDKAGTSTSLGLQLQAYSDGNTLKRNADTGYYEAIVDADSSDLSGVKMPVKLDVNTNAFPIKANASTLDITRTLKVSVVENVPATKILSKGTITVEVGKTANVDDFIAYGPSNANTGKAITDGDIEVVQYNDDADGIDYAVLNNAAGNHKLMGVAVGKCKVAVTFGSSTIYIPVNVVKRGATSLVEPTLSATEATLEVGGTTYITVKNPNTDADYEWTVNNENCTIVPGTDGEAVKIFAKKVGTSKVTCYAGNVEIGTITVTVKAADTTAPTAPGATQNPQTGDSIFAGLF